MWVLGVRVSREDSNPKKLEVFECRRVGGKAVSVSREPAHRAASLGLGPGRTGQVWIRVEGRAPCSEPHGCEGAVS